MKADPASGAVLLSAEPQLFVTDMARALAFWGGLGFHTVFAAGDPPYYAQVARDAARLNLRHVDALPMSPSLAARESLLAACVTLRGAAALEAEFRAAGAPLHQALRREAWGADTLILLDPDGNLVLFSEAASPPRAPPAR